MESVIYEDSPLAEYLEGASPTRPFGFNTMENPRLIHREGEGRARASQEASAPPSPTITSFAPRGPSTLQSRIRDNLPRPLRIPIPKNGPVARIHTACSVSGSQRSAQNNTDIRTLQRAVNSRLGRADNQRFLEHFRYLIVASQLLNEHTGQSSFRTVAIPNFGQDIQSKAPEFKSGSTSLTGALVTSTLR